MINKVSVKQLIEFKRLSEKSQTTFANNLKKPKKPKLDDDGGGGNYWVRSTSGISAAFKENDNIQIRDKIDAVSEKYEETEDKKVKIMYQRNLEILHAYEDFDFSIWRPAKDLKFPSKSNLLLDIKDLPIQVLPHHVFTYEKYGEKCVGGIWFVVWLAGFRYGDLGIFSEALFKYLSIIYLDKRKVDPNCCLIVDTLTKDVVTYQQVLDGKIPSLLENTVEALNKYLR